MTSLLSIQTHEELQVHLGERLRLLRINLNLDQISVAGKAGISEKALRNLENGRGSSIETLLRVLKALDRLDGIDKLVPKPGINSLSMLRNSKTPRRVRRYAKILRGS